MNDTDFQYPPGLPTSDGLSALLAPFRGERAYIIPLTAADGRTPLGNNGDFLMHKVFYRLLESMGITPTNDRHACDVAIVPPNGALLEIYAFPSLLKERLRGLEHLPLFIFPSSAFFPNNDPATIFEGRTAATHWVLREAPSLEHLESTWGDGLASAGVELHLDHDVVASGHVHVPSILGGVEHGGGLLVAARVDTEAHDISGRTARAETKRPNLIRRMRRAVPYGPWYTAAARVARRDLLANAGSRMIDRLPSGLAGELAGVRNRRCVDLSATQYATFGEYLRILRSIDLVVTDRLHVALPAAVTGKSVILVEAGYHKLSGVHAQSLASLGNVRLVHPGKLESER